MISGAASRPDERTSKATILSLLAAAALPAVLVGNAVLLLVHPWLVDAQYLLPWFPDDALGLAGHERRELAHAGVRSVAAWDGPGIERLREARLPAGGAAFGAREIAHMEDVRRLVTGIAWVWVAALATLCASVLALRRAGPPGASARAIGLGSKLTLGAMAALGLLMLADFEAFFDSFHGVFFDAGTWRFNDGDTLRALYPDFFWALAAGALALLVAAQAVAALVLARRVGDRRAG